MPRFKKKRWVSFKKKVTYVADTQNKKMVMYHKDAFDVASAADAQNYFDCMLFSGWNNTAGAGQTQWFDMLRVATESQQSAGTTNYARFYVKSARMNMTYYNAGSTPCYMDLYWYRCVKDHARSPQDIWAKSILSTFDQEVPVVGTNLNDPHFFGTTPFQANLAQYIKIYKVTKHYMAANQSIEFVLTDNRNHMVKNTALEQNANAVAGITPLTILKGKTQGVIGVVYGVPNGAAGGANQYANAATVYCRREVQYVFHPVGVTPGTVIEI